MLVSEFDYELPRELIAQEPAERRDASRLLVLERSTGALHDERFTDLARWLVSGDVLVINDTRVIEARLYGRLKNGARAEILLLRRLGPGRWETMGRPSRKMKPGAVVELDGFRAIVENWRPDGLREVRFEPEGIEEHLAELGELALPPYIKKKCDNPERYQTVYAQRPGAVAAPTAGLHFTPEFLTKLEEQGVEIVRVTLHAGLGTFRPVKAETVETHKMHPEEFELGEEAAAAVNRALDEGRRVVCVGTTTVRVLESRAEERSEGRSQMSEAGLRAGLRGHEPEFDEDFGHVSNFRTRWRVKAGGGETNLYIHPGYEWKVAGALLTNFHLPKSTLLMLVSSFAGIENTKAAYQRAIAERYRFYSFGDAMFIV